jgi:tetrapyrrole methylase family protein/MazG family protein
MKEYFGEINKNKNSIKRCQETQIFTREKMNFGYNTQEEIVNDLKDELNELYIEMKKKDVERIKSEMGDVIFVLCSLSNIYKIDLGEANTEYQERLIYIENRLENEKSNKNVTNELWEEAKNRNKK